MGASSVVRATPAMQMRNTKHRYAFQEDECLIIRKERLWKRAGAPFI